MVSSSRVKTKIVVNPSVRVYETTSAAPVIVAVVIAATSITRLMIFLVRDSLKTNQPRLKGKRNAGEATHRLVPS
jgi:hypothetical protein